MSLVIEKVGRKGKPIRIIHWVDSDVLSTDEAVRVLREIADDLDVRPPG